MSEAEAVKQEVEQEDSKDHVIDASDLGPEAIKWDYREKVWDHIELKSLANFPRPVHHRIPNFKGAEVASDKAATLEIFQKARTVKINPDKPQQEARFKTLEAHKNLLVPTPRLKSGLFNKIVPPADANKEILRKCSVSIGIKEYGVPLDLEDKVKIDLIIVGSVVVSQKGYRIGKGEGFADLEYAMMRAMGAVDENTPIVTIVHDCQVLDIPDRLKEDHDLTVDYIVTPTRIIECEKQKKPDGIIWSKLYPEKLEQVPILKILREKEEKAGKDVTLGVAPDPPAGATGDDGSEAKRHNDRDNNRRYGRRRPYRRGRRFRGPRRRSERESESKSDSRDEDHEGGSKRRQRKPRNQRNSEPAIYVGSLPRSLRVSEFKAKIREKNVNPMRVVWRGNNGFAFLMFQEEAELNKALENLSGLKIDDKEIKVDMSNRSKDKPGDKESKDDADSPQKKEEVKSE